MSCHCFIEKEFKPDSRAGGYIAKFGHTCWELDALEPSELARLVESTVDQYRDEDRWDAAVERERTARRNLLKIADQMDQEARD